MEAKRSESMRRMKEPCFITIRFSLSKSFNRKEVREDSGELSGTQATSSEVHMGNVFSAAGMSDKMIMPKSSSPASRFSRMAMEPSS